MSFALAVHGGAGTLRDDAGHRALTQTGLRDALAAGHAVLQGGGSALDAVVAAVCVLEDCPTMNAGRGSVLNEAGAVELDAAVMEGPLRRAGAVACVRSLANPVRAARAVLDDARHVLLAGAGAEAFAHARGLPAVDPETLVVPGRREQLARVLASRDASAAGRGTVGAVARDAQGRLAAATSTGGLMGKREGRVSDSALCGAGTWADDRCAVSATGQGEAFIRTAFAHAVALRVAERGLSLPEACALGLEEIARVGGSGGCIAIAGEGAPVLRFDTPAMPRGSVGPDGALHFALGPEALAP